MESVLPENAILCSNTSSLPITELAVCKTPAAWLGMHFFYPASVMSLVEVIGRANTRPETLDEVARMAESIGKMPVRVAESAGFGFWYIDTIFYDCNLKFQ